MRSNKAGKLTLKRRRVNIKKSLYNLIQMYIFAIKFQMKPNKEKLKELAKTVTKNLGKEAAKEAKELNKDTIDLTNNKEKDVVKDFVICRYADGIF